MYHFSVASLLVISYFLLLSSLILVGSIEENVDVIQGYTTGWEKDQHSAAGVPLVSQFLILLGTLLLLLVVLGYKGRYVVEVVEDVGNWVRAKRARGEERSEEQKGC